MANALYDTYKELILGAGLNLSSLDVRAALIDTDEYTFSAAHDFLNDVESGSPSAIISRSAALTSKTITNGVFDADNTAFLLLLDLNVKLLLYLDTQAVMLPLI